MAQNRTTVADNHRGVWLKALRVYVPFVAVANLLWETAHLPLYIVWQEGNEARGSRWARTNYCIVARMTSRL